MNSEKVNHPDHYGGKDNPYEAIKVINAWDLNFNLGSTLKYICRHGKKDPSEYLTDLKKAAWYLQNEIDKLSSKASEDKSGKKPEVTHIASL